MRGEEWNNIMNWALCARLGKARGSESKTCMRSMEKCLLVQQRGQYHTAGQSEEEEENNVRK